VLETDAKQVIRFGTFEVDPRAGELRRNGSRVKLQDQPFQVLLALVAKPGDVVTREELRAKLWPADTFVDFDHGLNAAVKRLRDALGDTAENPRFIETLAKRGYRFLVPLQGHAVPPSSAVLAPVPPATTTGTTGGYFTRWQISGVLGSNQSVSEADLHWRNTSIELTKRIY
jgi:DNA-binding winged helix-turn-helix (wHTH) protein